MELHEILEWPGPLLEDARMVFGLKVDQYFLLWTYSVYKTVVDSWKLLD